MTTIPEGHDDDPMVHLLGEELTLLNQQYKSLQDELGVSEIPITDINMRLTCLIRQIFPEITDQLKFEITVVQLKTKVLEEIKDDVEKQKDEAERTARIEELMKGLDG